MVEINGTEYPFAFTYKCMRELMGKVNDLSEMQQSEEAFVLAINKGYQRNGDKTRIKRQDLIDLLDEDAGAFKRLSDALARDMEQFTGGTGEGN